MKLKPEQLELLKDMQNTPYGKALKAFLDEQYADIGNILETKSWEETLGRQFALNVLKDLFAIIGSPKDEVIRRTNQYE